jgi:hypothetical protein
MKVAAIRLVPAALFVLAACSDDSSGPGPQVEDARLRVVPGIAAMPLVDVIVDGIVKASNVPYASANTTIALSAGTHQVKVVAPGTAPSAGGLSVNLSTNDTTTVVVVGTAAAPNPVALSDTGAIPAPGTGKLRVTHLATNAPAIDVYRSQPDFPAFTKMMEPFAYQASSSFVQSTPGNWIIRVTADNSTTVLAESSPIRVDAGWVRTILLLDAPNGGVRITPLGEQ